MIKKFLMVFVSIAILLYFGSAFGCNGVCGREIIATPIGYEYLQGLENGDVVRAFTTTWNPTWTNECRAVLFTVLNPERYYGKSFLLQDSGCNCVHCRYTTLHQQYVVGCRYSFPNSTNLVSILFNLSDPREMRIVNAREVFGKRTLNKVANIRMTPMKSTEAATEISLKHMWNADLKDLAETVIPACEYKQTTLGSILDHVSIEYGKRNPGKTINWNVECGNGPPDVDWEMPYDFSHGNVSALEVLEMIGRLPYVSFRVDTSLRSCAFFLYSFPADSEYCDWSRSIYSNIIPNRAFEKATVEELVQWLYSVQERWVAEGKISGATYSYGIKSSYLRTKTRPMSFVGMTLREAIRYIAREFDVEYDFKTAIWQERK